MRRVFIQLKRIIRLTFNLTPTEYRILQDFVYREKMEHCKEGVKLERFSSIYVHILVSFCFLEKLGACKDTFFILFLNIKSNIYRLYSFYSAIQTRHTLQVI